METTSKNKVIVYTNKNVPKSMIFDIRYHKNCYSIKVLFSKNGRIRITRIYFDTPEAITYKYMEKYGYHDT